MVQVVNRFSLLLAQATPPTEMPVEPVSAPHTPGAVELLLHASLPVQLTVLILLAFSVISWGIILYKFRFLRQATQESQAFTEAFWQSNGLEEAYESVKQYPHAPVAQVFRAGYAELRRLLQDNSDANKQIGAAGIDNVTRALRRAGTAQLTSLERRLPFLATCGSTSPFIGLFGTVYGILTAFQKIGATGSASIATVGPAISEALIATAIGLFAAIPAVMAYNYFLARVRVLTAEMDNFAADFLNIVKRHFFKG